MGYLAKRFALAVASVYGIFALLAFSIDLADLFRRTAEKDVPAMTVVLMSLLKLPDIGQKLLPFAVLLGAIWAFSRMSRTHELVAARAAGISAWQFLATPLLVAIGLGVFAMTVYSPVASTFLAQYSRLEARYIRGEPSQLAVSSTGLWLRQGDAGNQSVIHALRVGEQGMRLDNVIVFRYQGQDTFAGRIDAKTADLGDNIWRLREAWVSGPDGRPVFHETYTLPTELTPSEIEESFASPDTMSFWDLPRFISNAERAGFQPKRHRLYWYSMFALPLLFMAMVFMAASFSFRLVRLGGVPQLLLAAALSGFAIYFLQDVTKAMGISGLLPLPLAAMAPAMVATLLGMTMLFYEEDG